MKMMALQNHRVVQLWDGPIPSTLAQSFDWIELPEGAPNPPDNYLYWDGVFYAPGADLTTLPADFQAAITAMIAPLDKYAFRQLFTIAERVAYDNFESNSGISDQNKALLRTVHADFGAAVSIPLAAAGTSLGLDVMHSAGLTADERKARVLLNLPPSS